MKKSLALICSLALVPALAACGDDEEDGGNGDRGGAGGAVPTEQAPAPGRTSAKEADENVEVKMQNVEFQPKDVTVARGGTVRWTNEDSVPHDVTKKSGPGKDFKSGEPGGMNKGDSYEQSFSAAGKIDYICTVHPKMVGTITVK